MIVPLERALAIESADDHKIDIIALAKANEYGALPCSVYFTLITGYGDKSLYGIRFSPPIT